MKTESQSRVTDYQTYARTYDGIFRRPNPDYRTLKHNEVVGWGFDNKHTFILVYNARTKRVEERRKRPTRAKRRQ